MGENFSGWERHWARHMLASGVISHFHSRYTTRADEESVRSTSVLVKSMVPYNFGEGRDSCPMPSSRKDCDDAKYGFVQEHSLL